MFPVVLSGRIPPEHVRNSFSAGFLMKLPPVGCHTIAEINRFPSLGRWTEERFKLGLHWVRGCVRDSEGWGVFVCLSRHVGAPSCKNVWTGCYEHRFSLAVETKRRRGGATVFDHLSLG